MKLPTAASRIGIVVLLTIASIAFHEFGHFVAYWLAGCPVRITLQSVRPVGDVSRRLNLLALAAGPAFSFAAAVVCLNRARRYPAFVWVTAAFINAATLRLFPLTMDVVRAIKQAKPFSDEGGVVIAITTNPTHRAMILLFIFAAFFSVAAMSARLYDFKRHRVAKVAGIYLLSLGVGIAMVLADEFLK